MLDLWMSLFVCGLWTSLGTWPVEKPSNLALRKAVVRGSGQVLVVGNRQIILFLHPIQHLAEDVAQTKDKFYQSQKNVGRDRLLVERLKELY